MPSLIRTRTISGRADDVWQELTDFRNWSRLSAHISHVELLESSSNSVLLECRDAAGLAFKVHARDWQRLSTLTILADASTPHPLGFLSLRFDLIGESSSDRNDDLTDQTQTIQVQICAEYRHRLPILGGFLERLGRQTERIAFVDSLVDGLALRVQKKQWQYKESVRTILARKGHTVFIAAPDELVSRLTELITDKRIGAVLIVDENENLVGLVSERDIVNRLSSDGAAVLNKTAADIMTRNLIVVEPDTDLMFVMACMTENKIRHLPVLKGGKLVGLISIGDVVQQRIHALEADSDTMRDYIAAREWRYHSPNGSSGKSSVVGSQAVGKISEKDHH